jgi:hypothetical protein
MLADAYRCFPPRPSLVPLSSTPRGAVPPAWCTALPAASSRRSSMMRSRSSLGCGKQPDRASARPAERQRQRRRPFRRLLAALGENVAEPGKSGPAFRQIERILAHPGTHGSRALWRTPLCSAALPPRRGIRRNRSALPHWSHRPSNTQHRRTTAARDVDDAAAAAPQSCLEAHGARTGFGRAG